jgi:hypothetical protein
MLWIVKFKIEVLFNIMFGLKLQCEVFLCHKVEIEIEVCFDVMEVWNKNLSCELNIKIKHESNYHWNKKFGLKLNKLHLFIQSPLSFARVGFTIIQMLEWMVC